MLNQIDDDYSPINVKYDPSRSFNIETMKELRKELIKLKQIQLSTENVIEEMDNYRNKCIKKYEKFCVAIKGNDQRCGNYARKECDERLCHSHRSLASDYVKGEPKKFVKKFEGTEDKCWKEGCRFRCQYIVLAGPRTKYCCWMHTQ